MEATINPLLATTKQSQSGRSAHAADLFSIDSGNIKVNGPESDSFSNLLQEKIEKKRAAEAKERNKLPSDGKDEQASAAREAASRADAAEQSAKQREAEERQSNDQQELAEKKESADRASRQSDAEERPKEAEQASDQGEQTPDNEEQQTSELDETALESALSPEEESIEALPAEGELDDEGLLSMQQPVTPAQEEMAEMMAPQVAAAQQQAAAEEPELDEVLMEEEMLKRSTMEQGRGREQNLPPELKDGEQQIHLGEEVDLKTLMSALKEQHHGDPAGDGQHHQGSNPGQGSGAQSASSLFSAADPLNAAERPTQLKGMTVTPQSRQWSSELGERILFMAGKKIQSAEIRLNPPNLGLLEVKLAISGDQAQLVFQSGNANVRDVLESAVPRIREMLEQQGINLTDVNVSDGKQQESSQSEEGEKRNGGGGMAGMGEGIEEEVVPISTMAVDRIGLVDYYI